MVPELSRGGVGGAGAGQHAAKVSRAISRYFQRSVGVIEDATIYRTKEQVLYDLSKALRFTPESLEANRKGRLSKEQVKQLAPQVILPMILTFVLAVGPLAAWTYVTAGRQQLSFENAFPALINELMHVHDLFEAHGKVG